MNSRFEKLKNDILGKDYSLSIAFVTEKKSQAVNKKYRRKDKATNVLSFPLRPNQGELLLCRSVIKKEAEDSGRDFSKWLEFLIIHGLLHLKGYDHGPKMKALEKKYLAS